MFRIFLIGQQQFQNIYPSKFNFHLRQNIQLQVHLHVSIVSNPARIHDWIVTKAQVQTSDQQRMTTDP